MANTTQTGRISHRVGRRKATDRQQPRKSKRATSTHSDKYATKQADRDMSERLRALAEHFNGEEADDA